MLIFMIHKSSWIQSSLLECENQKHSFLYFPCHLYSKLLESSFRDFIRTRWKFIFWHIWTEMHWWAGLPPSAFSYSKKGLLSQSYPSLNILLHNITSVIFKTCKRIWRRFTQNVLCIDLEDISIDSWK